MNQGPDTNLPVAGKPEKSAKLGTPELTGLVRVWYWILRLISPGYSYCLHCKKPWNYVKCHDTKYKPDMGCFPLCEKCWGKMDIEDRLPYYRQLWRGWGNFDRDGVKQWRELENAVRKGL